MVRKSKAKSKIKSKKGVQLKLLYPYITIFICLILVGVVFFWKLSQTTAFTRISGDTWSFVVPKHEANGPRFGKGIIKPRFPVYGVQQRVTITISDTAPVTKVSAYLLTDTKSSGPYEFLPGSGTSYNSDWTGVWTLDDTHNKKYTLSVMATSTNGTTTVNIPLK
ncbi:MAG: hypothetical protein NTV98_00745 [Candidatus Roizmanbacteria bacterium]|nr:hypothetical protein [Candidatus Roizmanbacteria bacterium]